MNAFTICLLFAISVATGIKLSNNEKSAQSERQGMFYLGQSPDDCEFYRTIMISPEYMSYIFSHPQYIACKEKNKALKEAQKKASLTQNQKLETLREMSLRYQDGVILLKEYLSIVMEHAEEAKRGEISEDGWKSFKKALKNRLDTIEDMDKEAKLAFGE